MKLPLLLSVPHAGWRVPQEVSEYSVLTEREILEDGDEGARGIYALGSEVERYLTTDVARAFVDLNRAPDDLRPDGVVKTHTCWSVPVYREPLPEEVIERLLDRYYRPYHRRLEHLTSGLPFAAFGVDCHTMAATGPPVAPDPGQTRPRVCVSYAPELLPDSWRRSLLRALRAVFGPDVRENDPFRGGYIMSRYGAKLPFVQLELSRAPYASTDEKRGLVLDALRAFCRDAGF